MSSLPVSAVPLSHVPVRRVGPPDAPFEGRVARGVDGAPVLLVDVDALGDWPGWRWPGDGHVWAPLDVVRRDDGHDLVLALPVERVERLVERRTADDALAEGEIVTLAVSVLRGLAEWGAAPDGEGEWWLTEAGRPVLVVGAGTDTPLRASASLLTVLADAAGETPLGEAVARVAVDVLDRSRRATALREAETAIFACATPTAVRTLVPERAPVLLRHTTRAEESVSARPGSWLGAFAFHLDAGLAATVSDAWTSLRRRRNRERPRSRRAVVACAGAAAALVLVVGVLWPTDEPEGAAAEPEENTVAVAPTDSAVPTAPVESAPVESAPPTTDPGSGSPQEAATHLLDAARACADAVCLADVWEDADRAVTTGAVAADPDVRSVHLLDEFGDLAVFRVGRIDGASATQLVTIVRTDDRWRVRDVYDATDPPS